MIIFNNILRIIIIIFKIILLSSKTIKSYNQKSYEYEILNTKSITRFDKDVQNLNYSSKMLFNNSF